MTVKTRSLTLGHPTTKARIGSLYLNVETVGKPLSLLFTPLFLVRRLIFAAIAILVQNNGPLQVFMNAYASLVLIFFYVKVWPMIDRVNNVIQLLNEVFFLVCIYLQLAFTDYTVDPVKKHDIGSAYLVFLGVNVTANVALIGYIFVKQVQGYYKNKQKKTTFTEKTGAS